MTRMEDYTRAVFDPLVGRVFEFDRPGPRDATPDRVQLELLEVSGPKRGSTTPGFREPFTLLFTLRSAEELGAGLHRIAQDDFEPCEWFLNRVFVPGRDARCSYYQAVFG
jgi:hypothetical protein